MIRFISVLLSKLKSCVYPDLANASLYGGMALVNDCSESDRLEIRLFIELGSSLKIAGGWFDSILT